MKIELEVFNENGIVKKELIDLTNKFLERDITQKSPSVNYTADENSNCLTDPLQGNNNQFNAVSGGQILPVQTINKVDKTTRSTQQFNKPISVNIKIRYDANENRNNRWNINVFVDMDDNKLNWQDKRLINKTPQKVHKAPHSNWIRVDYWIDGVKKKSIKSNCP